MGDFNPTNNRVIFDDLELYRRTGDADAWHRLLLAGQGFVRGIGRRCVGFMLGGTDDTTNIGTLGLARAIRDWQPELTKTWLYFASIKVRAALQSELRRQRRSMGSPPTEQRMPWITSTGMIQNGGNRMSSDEDLLDYCEQILTQQEHEWRDNMAPLDPNPSPPSIMEQSDALETRLAPLQHNPLAKRVLELTFWDDMSIDEIAARIHLRVGSVRAAYDRGMTKLRQQISDN